MDSLQLSVGMLGEPSVATGIRRNLHVFDELHANQLLDRLNLMQEPVSITIQFVCLRRPIVPLK